MQTNGNHSSEQTLNLDALNPSRQSLVTDALAGHAVEVVAGKFSQMSSESLLKVGITPIEVAAMEKLNQTTGTYKIPDNPEKNQPSSKNNPFTKENWNPDAQRKLHDTNQNLARKLMREAGLL